MYYKMKKIFDILNKKNKKTLYLIHDVYNIYKKIIFTYMEKQVQELERLYEKMKEMFSLVEKRHQDFISKKNKKAGLDVRKSLIELKKLITPYREKSLEISKSIKKR